MDGELVKVVAGYQPPWNNLLLQSPQAIRDHLVTEHNFAVNDISLLSDAQCWEAHDRCHEAKLGVSLIQQ